MSIENGSVETPMDVHLHRAIGEFIDRYIILNDTFPNIAKFSPFVEVSVPIKRFEDQIDGISFGGPNVSSNPERRDGFGLTIYWKQPNSQNVLYRRRMGSEEEIDAYAMISASHIYHRNLDQLPHNTLPLFKVYPLTKEPDIFIRKQASSREMSLIALATNSTVIANDAAVQAAAFAPINDRYELEAYLQRQPMWYIFVVEILQAFCEERPNEGLPEGGFKKFFLEYLREHT
jgi:hypothetical protein